jgi:IS5 family transposase
METCQSPRKVLLEAWQLALQVWRLYSNPFSRHDFTLPQLFACLILREMLKLSYRKAEKLLRDSPDWLREIGMSKSPDHNTLWRAFKLLVETKHVNRMLDLQAKMFDEARLLQLSSKPLTIDSTCFERRHRSRHYDRVCRKMHLLEGGKYTEKTDQELNRSRSRKVRQMPKLALAVASACHLILAARTHTGNGSDHPDFDPLLYRAWKRAPVKIVVADAGYDSEKNHRLARLDMNVRSIIPPKIGRPSDKPAKRHYRRLMQNRFRRKADKKYYSQRAQSETVNSMMKRNLGDSLRSIKPQRREQEMFLRTLTHNFMLLSALK